MLYKTGQILIPVMIHFLALQCVYLLCGRYLDLSVCTALAALVTLPLFVNLYRRDASLWKKEKRRLTLWSALLVIAGAVVLNYVLSGVIYQFTVARGVSNEAQEALFAGALPVQIIGTGILVPITEEYLFRGLVYGRMERYLSRGASLFLAAALFAVYHGNPVQILFAFPMGLVLNLLYRHFGDLKAPILFHMASNLGAIVLQCLT